MPQTTTPEYIRQRLEQAGFNELSVNKLMNVNPELALTAIKAKQLYEAAHPGKSFQVEQGFRSKIQQQNIAALGSAYTNASGKKGHESPHQFGQAIDFHILEKNGKEWVRQPDNRENPNDYVDVANAMKQAAQELGYASKFNYGALGDVHVGRGKRRHNDWGHIEEKKHFWNQWRPGQGVQIPTSNFAKPPQQQQCIPCVQKPPKQPPKAPSLLDMILQPLQQFPFRLNPPRF
ncbi:MAG: hypothetical protein EPN97_11425 [Alphaproteobacteria bacterium]|nr:MAG: hypothetical protein EPN97_11425 [Alphaproteobacteria bacterium]